MKTWKKIGPKGTTFEVIEDDVDELVYITTSYGYGFAIPIADFTDAAQEWLSSQSEKESK